MVQLRFVRLVFTALGVVVLAVLAACSTASRPAPGAGPATSTVSPSVLAPASAGGQVPSPDAASVNILPVDEVAQHGLLAGEVPREFQRGHASWYGPGFNGRRTASGERFDMHALTAAHRTLPFGTMVRVRSLVNGREVDVRITDRGPYSRGRIIDVSRAAAEELGMLGLGFKQVVLFVPESTPVVAELPPTPPKRVRKQPSR